MYKKKQAFWKIKQTRYKIPKNRQEEQLFINPYKYRLKKNNNKKIKLIYIFASIIILFLLFILIINIIIKKKKNETKDIIKSDNFFDKYNVIYNKFKINETDIIKYKNMLPKLSADENAPIPSIDEIFNERQLFISDARITPEYIRFIRPINETEEEKYKKRYSEGDTLINNTIFQKRPDQYDYKDFCKLALEEKLIDNKTLELESNKPLISIVIPSYNKKNILLKSVRSIQNQKYKNFEIIIVNDCSTDNSTGLFNYLIETDPRIRIIHHMKNMGCLRTRLDGIIYSKGKYIILFDAGDLYEDNYVLIDALNIIQTYNLDSCKFLFRVLRTFNRLDYSFSYFKVGNNSKIIYGSSNIKNMNYKIFLIWGNIWNRLVRDNIYSKAIYLLNESSLNMHKNVWDDIWFNNMVHKASFSFAIFERIGYVYLQDGNGEGSPQARNDEEKSKMVKEYVGFLQFELNFAENKEEKNNIIKKLKEYNETHHRFRLSNFRAHFEVLNELLENLIKDPDISPEDKKYCQKLLDESIKREKDLNKAK